MAIESHIMHNSQTMTPVLYYPLIMDVSYTVLMMNIRLHELLDMAWIKHAEINVLVETDIVEQAEKRRSSEGER